MDNRFNIDLFKLTRLNNPERLSLPEENQAWLNITVKPLAVAYAAFIRWCDATVYDLKLTGQVCSLERMLNNRYDFSQRRIYIDDGIIKPTKYIFQHAELKPKYIYRRSENKPLYIYTSSEVIATAASFVVYVPLDIQLNLTEIISLIRKKRLVGKSFKIQRF